MQKVLMSSLLFLWGITAQAASYEIDALQAAPFARQQIVRSLPSPQLFSIVSFVPSAADQRCASLGATYLFLSSSSAAYSPAPSAQVRVWLGLNAQGRCEWKASVNLAPSAGVRSPSLDADLAAGRVLTTAAIVAKINEGLTPQMFSLQSFTLMNPGHDLSTPSHPTYYVTGSVAGQSRQYLYDAIMGDELSLQP